MTPEDDHADRSPTGSSSLLLSAAMRALRVVARHRLVHFMTLGTVLFLLSPRDREHDGRDITIEPDRIDARFRSARARVSHPLSATEKQVAIGELVEEEVLAREALRLGIGVEDPILRARLADRMRATLASTLPKGDIGEDEIAAESARRAAAAPLRVRLDVHYFRKEGTDAHEAAERFAQRPGENREHEDRPPIPDGAWWTEEALARVVGANVAHVAMTTEVGRASAPTTSAWGVWIVVPLERRSASPTELRAEAREEILRQRQAAGIARLVEHARRDYRVQIRTLAGTTLEPESID